jgi:ankyrin repeat protein
MTTPLWHAAFEGHKGVVQVLLSTNAVNVNAASVANHTPLFLSAACGHTDIVKLLLSHGASQDYVDSDGWSPLAIAKYYGHAKIVGIFVKEKKGKNSVNVYPCVAGHPA